MSKSLTASVAKGTFVFNGTKKKSEPKVFCPGDSWRYSQYSHHVKEVDEIVKSIQQELHADVFTELLKFVSSSHNVTSSASVQEIPTASLVTGVNQADHLLMFSELVDLLRHEVTPHIAVLSSKDCNSTKAAMASLLSQLLKQPAGMSDEDEVEGPGLGRRSDHSVEVLVTWYTEQVNKFQRSKGKSSPRKRSSTGKLVSYQAAPPVVVVLEDVEAFTGVVLQDLITILSGRLRSLPVVLVLGVATAVTALHRLLPHQVTCLLCIEKFQTPPATECLSLLVEKLMMGDGCRLRLGGRVFNQLINTFLCHDFSLSNFISAYKFAILEHFTENPVSCVCAPHDTAVDHLTALSSSQLDMIRSAASFRRYVESLSPETQIKLLEDDKYCKKEMTSLLKRLEDYHQTFFPVMRCLHVFSCDLPKLPLGRHLRELYAECLSRPVTQNPDYKQVMSLLRTLCCEELKKKLRGCCHLLANNDVPASLGNIRTKLEEFISELDKSDEGHEESEVTVKDEDDLILPRMDFTALKKTLQEKKKKKMTAYEILRNDCMEFLDSVFRDYLVSHHSCPLYETCYYSNWSSLQARVNGCPRAVVQRGLANPHHYLMHADTRREDGLIPASLPDICIVYLLHMECGRRINLYDWLESFHVIITAGTDEEDKHASKVTQARFIQAVSELQFLGFIKPTKQKTDHVARLTWGGC